MTAVAVAAILVASLIEAEKAWKRHVRYVSALRAFQASRTYYGEGRVTLEHCVEKSRCLMETQLTLSSTKEEQAEAVRAG
jgi:hypothetical protein